MREYRIGEKYLFCTKEECIRNANQAKNQGFDVRFGSATKSGIGPYYFEIVDPFKEAEG